MNLETANTESEVPTTETQTSLRSAAEMKARAFNELVAIHLQQLTSVMMATNRVTQLQKRQANVALVEAVQFALDFGVGVTNSSIRDRGSIFAQETNNLAGVLVQALDNRMLLLADNLRKKEELEKVATQPLSTEVEESKGE